MARCGGRGNRASGGLCTGALARARRRVQNCPALGRRKTMLRQQPQRFPLRIVKLAECLRAVFRGDPAHQACRRPPICTPCLVLRGRRLVGWRRQPDHRR
eukprot:2898325-Lingulodinium_polyedra.AAC.1